MPLCERVQKALRPFNIHAPKPVGVEVIVRGPAHRGPGVHEDRAFRDLSCDVPPDGSREVELDMRKPGQRCSSDRDHVTATEKEPYQMRTNEAARSSC